jgi:hypothetical protein
MILVRTDHPCLRVRRHSFLRSRPPLPRHQCLLQPRPGPLPVKQCALTPQASIGDRRSGATFSLGQILKSVLFSPDIKISSLCIVALLA